MVMEQGKTLEVLKIALQMEIDGKKYYQKVSRSSDNQMGKQLFQSLAEEEDCHRQRFEEIYDAIRNKKVWPVTDFKTGGGQKLRTMFVEAAEMAGSQVAAPATELEAIQVAIGMENKSYDFYKDRGKNATGDAERDFYEALAAEEREHHLVLLDYYEYLEDPAGWFVAKEHSSMDGG